MSLLELVGELAERGRSSAGAVPSALSSAETSPPLRDEVRDRGRPAAPPRSARPRGRARTARGGPRSARRIAGTIGQRSNARAGQPRVGEPREPLAARPSSAPAARLRASGLASAATLASTRERGRLRHREIREALAIDRVARGLQPGDELTVGQPVLARRGVDAHDPQAAEVALLAAAADERVLERGVDRLFRGAIELALGLIEALGAREQLLALRAPDISTFDSRH